jgi:UDP-N-acetylmuramoylalanine--D-glutamate ligase
MGLGLHGGGLASARFFASRGASVTVTDLKDAKALETSVEQLVDLPIRFVLGRHETADFTDTDLVIKNPGVPVDSGFLALARDKGVTIETDISIFLAHCENPVIAVTGSKGKSTTVSAIHFCLSRILPETRLGGNITVSPLTFFDDLEPGAWVVLELSSWQLADLAGKNCLKPKISLITNILPDHMNRYKGMDDYVDDKKIIYALQDADDFSIFNHDDPYSLRFVRESCAQKLVFSSARLPGRTDGAWLVPEGGVLRVAGEEHLILPSRTVLKGEHNRLNLLAAGIALFAADMLPENISAELAEFPGIEHRFEEVARKHNVTYINDSAATIPHAVVQAVKTAQRPIVLITGGTDKNIDFTPLLEIEGQVESIVLLAGSATEKIRRLFDARGIAYAGPFDNLGDAVQTARQAAVSGGTILFSPGCASFGMFQNEFDRGRQFKKIVASC